MKICRIICAYPPYSFGGADIRAEKIDQALDQQSIERVIISIHPQKKETVERKGTTTIYRFYPFNIASIHTIGKKPILKQAIWTAFDIYNLYSYNKIKSILQKERPDVVHLHTPLDVTLSTINAVKSLKIPLIYTLHDYFLLCRRFVLMHGFKEMCTDKNISLLCLFYRTFTRRIINNKIDIVIAPSQFVLEIHKRYGFFKKTKAIVLPHGIELDNEENVEVAQTTENKEFNIAYVGVLRPHKGIQVLIMAFKKIVNEKIKLHILGGGVFEKELKQIAKGDNRIIFYGKKTYQEIQLFFKNINITVVPSIWYDVRPNVVVESFKSGVPVIASNIGGIPELVKDGYNGFLFEAGNQKALTSILKKSINDPQQLKTLGKNARKFVEKFEISNYVKRLTEIYRMAIQINNEKK